MCLAVIQWQPGQPQPLKIVANRDEFRARPTLAMHWWPDTDILAGKDLQAGGTWLGFNRQRKFALLTNIRPGYLGVQGNKTRGELISGFLQQNVTIEQFHQQLQPCISDYAGFNLLLGDAERLFWFSSTNPEGQWLGAGIHTLSNDSLNTPWPKAELARQQMAQQHNDLGTTITAHSILQSTDEAAKTLLPDTGVPLEWEKKLSSQTIVGEEYGTRCRTHVVSDSSGVFRVVEQQLDNKGDEIERAAFQF